jgi:hypothetical protein
VTFLTILLANDADRETEDLMAHRSEQIAMEISMQMLFQIIQNKMEY